MAEEPKHVEDVTNVEVTPPKNSMFGISVETLEKLNESKSVKLLNEQFGGVEGLLTLLATDARTGLKKIEESTQYVDRIQEYGLNVYPQPPMKNLFVLFLAALNNLTLIILMFFGILSIILGVAFPEREEDRKIGWIEGAAIELAVFVVASVSAVNDYSKELKFRALSKKSKEIFIKAIRGGENISVPIAKLLAGDIVSLETGDQVPADGIIIQSQELKIDESVMTGESDLISKNEKKPFMLSGCQVAEGYGKMVITAVGLHSEWGKLLAKLAGGDDSKTPLEERLDGLAQNIGKVGLTCGILTFLFLIIGWIIRKYVDTFAVPPRTTWDLNDLVQIVRFVVVGVTIVVVAVPEGLPLAVTISLAYSVRKMMKDNNLVRHLSACETMGGATNICSDKTGTLTLNQMRVVRGFFAGKYFTESLPKKENIPEKALLLLTEGIAINTKANSVKSEDASKEFEVQGSKTESALLILSNQQLETDYLPIRSKIEESGTLAKLYPFTAVKKRMGVIISTPTSDKPYRLHYKGASEIVLELCSSFMNASGDIEPLPRQKKEELNNIILEMAKMGLRTLCLAYKDLDESAPNHWDTQENVEQDLVCLAIVGIKDPLRPEVYGAVAQCKKSGIVVRMVTGDNIYTASHIAKDCGILGPGELAIEGPKFRVMSDTEIEAILPKLKVMARSSPEDKFKLVAKLRSMNEVVAVTGDGTNDAPALKEADVGLSMGISGTQVAKEASDIIIMDDNFDSIVKSVLWGRSIFENIRKFLTFQLSVNIVALVMTSVTAATTFIVPGHNHISDTGQIMYEPPIAPVQLLWINLIMDSFGALALATEPPHISLLDRKPYGRKERQLFWTFFIYYAGEAIGMLPKELVNTMVFNTFVWCQLFNELKSLAEFNLLQNIHKSPMFLLIMLVTAVFQVVLVEVPYVNLFARATNLHVVWYLWPVSLAIGIGSIPFSLIVRAIVRLIWYIKENRAKKANYQVEPTNDTPQAAPAQS